MTNLIILVTVSIGIMILILFGVTKDVRQRQADAIKSDLDAKRTASELLLRLSDLSWEDKLNFLVTNEVLQMDSEKVSQIDVLFTPPNYPESIQENIENKLSLDNGKPLIRHGYQLETPSKLSTLNKSFELGITSLAELQAITSAYLMTQNNKR